MSNRSYTDLLMDEVEYRIHLQLQTYVPPLLLLVGTVGNVLSFCVLMRRTMRVTSTYNYLAVLAVLDTLVLYADCFINFLEYSSDFGRIADLSDWSCKLIHMIVYTVSVSSVWLLIAVTVDRYIATVHGIHAMTMCTQRRAVRVIVCILVFFILLHIHFLWTMELRESGKGYVCKGAEAHAYLVHQIWPLVDVILYCFTPFTFIAILNTLIIIQVVKSRRNSQLASDDTSDSETHPAWNTSDHSIRVTIMLLVISFTFLVCMFPFAVFSIYRRTLLSPDTKLTYPEFARIRLVRTICKLLLYVNHCINFYLYLLSGQKFRQEMIEMIRCWVCCPKRSQESPRTFSTYYSTSLRKSNDMTTAMVTARKYSGQTANNTAL